MPSSCWAPNCTSRLKKHSSIKMYRFPMSNKDRLDKWLINIGRIDLGGQGHATRQDGLLVPKAHDRICSLHFSSGRPSPDPNDLDYIPTYFEKIPTSLGKVPINTKNRKDRMTKKARLDTAQTLLDLSGMGMCQLNHSHSFQVKEEPGTSTQTEMIGALSVCTQTDFSSLQDIKDIHSKENGEVELKKIDISLVEKLEIQYKQQILALEEENEKLKRRIMHLEDEYFTVPEAIHYHNSCNDHN